MATETKTAWPTKHDAEMAAERIEDCTDCMRCREEAKLILLHLAPERYEADPHTAVIRRRESR